jgi:hypothetical protein
VGVRVLSSISRARPRHGRGSRGGTCRAHHHLETILVNGEVTGAPDKRVAGGAVPPTRPKQAATASSDYLRTRSLKPEWRGSGLLTRRPVDRNHSRPPEHTHNGPVTVAVERAGLLSRQLYSSSQVRILPGPPFLRGDDRRCVHRCVCTPIGRGSALRAHSVAVRVGPDAPTCFAPSVARLNLDQAPLRIW